MAERGQGEDITQTQQEHGQQGTASILLTFHVLPQCTAMYIVNIIPSPQIWPQPQSLIGKYTAAYEEIVKNLIGMERKIAHCTERSNTIVVLTIKVKLF